jgi:predicted anti-sigma-YlaC factor YlaD
MSHTDDGTLHSYLDGQLSSREAVELERHVADCAECRVRLDEERALIKRAGRLLALAAPPERAAPPWPGSEPLRLWWRLRAPLTWAATLMLAVGLAWSLRGVLPRARPELGGAAPRGQHQAARDVALAPALRAAAPAAAAPAAPAAPAAAPAPLDSARAAPAAPAPPAPSASTLRRGAPLFPPSSTVVAVGEAPRPSGALAARRDALDAWQEIGFDAAGRLLGQPPVAIPGMPIRRLARPRSGAAVLVVDQLVDSGTVVRLYEQRRGAPLDSLQAFAERTRALAIAREVGPLHIEIQGALTPDSLTRLLQLVK